jgi:ribonucleoside-diphosphate reductase alpha chain
MVDRKFIPGGRYLYAAGREWHQVNNCLAGEEKIVTEDGIFSLESLVGEKVRVLNRHGCWEDAEVRAFGKQELKRIHLSDGRTIDATANHRWWQADGSRVTTDLLTEIPVAPAAPVLSLDSCGVQHGIVYGDGQVATKGGYSYVVLIGKKSELAARFDAEPVTRPGRYGNPRTFLPIRKIKAGTKVSLQPLYFKSLPGPETTPEYARGFIAGLIATDGSTKGSGVTISCEGWTRANDIAALAVLGGCRVRSVRIVSGVSPFTGEARELCIVSLENATAPIIATYQERKTQYSTKPCKVLKIEDTGRVEEVYCVVAPTSQSFTLANGLITSNCFLFRAEDSSEGWSELMGKSTAALMSGGGIGVDYSALRAEGAEIKRKGGKSTGPIALMQMVNEAGRHIMQGGARRSAIWAGLAWHHPDVEKFINLKNWSPELRAQKERDFTFPMPMELTNISVIYDTEFFNAMRADMRSPRDATLAAKYLDKLQVKAKTIWLQNCKQAFKTAEPGMAFNFMKDLDSLRNACTEVTSEDDDDKCNLGTVWMNRCDTIEEFHRVVRLGTLFLMCGGVYSDVPTEAIREVGLKNNRIGLGLGGMHEWLMQRGMPYEVTQEMHQWLYFYVHGSEEVASLASKRLGVAYPKGLRAIAPTGSIGILAETTTGIEPLFCKAYKRRYFKDNQWHAQYVIDGSVKSLVGRGVKLEQIQDSFDLGFEQRIRFQADVQDYVDMAISSTCNMPAWGSETNNDSTVESNVAILLKYAHRLRGFTCYPDGARGGQPLTRVPLEEALKNEGQVIVEGFDTCEIGRSGTCGS